MENAVYLYEDKIILTFNDKDDSKTITLAEVEGSDLSVLGANVNKAVKPWKIRDFKGLTGLITTAAAKNTKSDTPPNIKKNKM